MNFPYYLAKRLSRGKSKGSSGLIIRIAVMGVALSVAIMIVSLAIVKGYQQEIKNKITGFGTHIQISKLDLNNSFETVPIQTDTLMERQIKTTRGIAHMQPFAIKPGIIKTAGEFEGVVLKGVSNTYSWQFLKQYLISGDTLHFDSAVSNRILISETVANRLHLKLGDAVTMYFVQDPPRARRFTIAGVYNTGFEEMDKLYVFADLRQVQKLNNWFEGAISGYEVFVDDVQQVDQRVMQIIGYLPYNLQLRTTREMHPELYDWLGLLDLNVVVIVLLMIIIACINMITALLILIVERSNMIGILKALGLRNGSMSRVFVWMALYLTVAGLLIGNAVGLGVCISQQVFGWFKLDAAAYFLDRVPILISGTDLLLINGLAFVVCYLMLLLPARYVSRITPAKAIRFE